MTKRFKISCLTSLGLFLAASPALMAQITTGQISGRVTDSSNKPLRAKVVLTAPQLMGQREIQTDANGEWRALLLPPGDYTIRISADGHVGATARNIRIGVGAALRQDSVLKPITAASTTVEVVSTENIVVDKTDTKTVLSFSADRLAQLTGGRDIGSAVSLTPGAISTGGGTYSIRGSGSGSTILRLDGADMKDPNEGRVNATWYLADSIEEVAVVLSPLNARYGRTVGGSLDVVTKSGGNEFSGTFRVNPGRSSWGAEDRTYIETWGEHDSLSSRTQDFTLGGPIIKDRLWFTLAVQLNPGSSETYATGGKNDYILPARVWEGDKSNGIMHTGINSLMAVDPVTMLVLPSAAPQIQGYYVPFPYNANKEPVTHGYPTWVLDQRRQRYSETSFYTGKLTYGINQDHKVTLGGQYQKRSNTNKGIVYRDEQAFDSNYTNQGVNFTYNGILGSSTFAEVKFNRQKQANNFLSGREDGAAGYAIEMWLDNPNRATQALGAAPEYGEFLGKFNTSGSRLTVDDRNNAFGSVNVTMYRDFWGMNHNIDTGLEYYMADTYAHDMAGPDNALTIIGGIFQNQQGNWLFPVLKFMGAKQWGQSDAGRSGPSPSRRQYYANSGNYKNTNLSLYINDQMTINDHWNVMLGLRYDKTSSDNTDGTNLFGTSSLSPRLMLTYDVKGDSAHVFKFSYNRMHSDYPVPFVRGFLPTYITGQSRIDWMWSGAALSGGQPDPGTAGDIQNGREMYGLRFVTLEQLVNPANYTIPIDAFKAGMSRLKDPNMKPNANDEFALEYRRSYQNGSYAKAAYVYRVMSNAWASKIEYDPDYWVTIDPSDLVSGTGLVLASRLVQVQKYGNVSGLWRDYHGLELETMTRINSIFSLTLNYTYSRLRGNSESNDGGGNFGDDAGTSAQGYYAFSRFYEAMGIPIEQHSPSGALGSDSPHRLVASLSAVVPLGTRGSWISYSLLMGYTSGGNWTATYAHPVGTYFKNIYDKQSATSSMAIPSTYPNTWTKYYSSRGAYHWNDTHWANATIAWEVPLWKRLKTMGNITINNVFNMIYHTSYNNEFQSYSSGETGLNPKGHLFGGVLDSNGRLSYTNSPRSVGLSIGLKF